MAQSPEADETKSDDGKGSAQPAIEWSEGQGLHRVWDSKTEKMVPICNGYNAGYCEDMTHLISHKYVEPQKTTHEGEAYVPNQKNANWETPETWKYARAV